MHTRLKYLQDTFVIRDPLTAAAFPTRLFGYPTLRAASVPPNPYPNGISVAGTGSTAPWRIAYMPRLGIWVANTGFGAAPIYSDVDFARIFDQITGELVGLPSVVMFDDFSRNPVLSAGQLSFTAGNGISIGTPDGGSQGVYYGYDQSKGLWKPTSARGFSKPSTTLWDKLIEAGAIIGGAVALGASAAGYATSAGPGAEAVGGSAVSVGTSAPAAAVDVTASAAGAVAPAGVEPLPAEIVNFAPPSIAPVAPVDLASSAPLNIASVSDSAITAATDPLTKVFNISKYISTLSSAYTSVAKLTSGAPHPQTGYTLTLPDGSKQVTNPDGTVSITQPNGLFTNIGPSTGNLILYGGLAALAAFLLLR
jgi:hypothetical protein